MCVTSRCNVYFLLWVGVKKSSILPGLEMEVGKKRSYPFLYILLQAISYDIFLYSSVLWMLLLSDFTCIKCWERNMRNKIFFFTMCTSLGIILPNKISFQGHLLKFQLFVYSKSQNPMKMLILPTSINVFGFQLIIPLSLKTPDTDKHLIITILKQL